MSYEYAITNKHYHTISYYLKEKYNKKVFKVPLNASFTCPNRDGTKAIGGCYFCSANGSGDTAGNKDDDLLTQFEEIKKRQLKKWNDAYYIAYFQAYSNTYASIETMKEKFELFIGKENVIGLSIATRCDCLDEEKVCYLANLKKHFKEFWIELGLQSCKVKTMKDMNLQYNLNDFKKAVRLLRKYNIDVIVHIIDGLPNESETDMLNTIKFINKLDIQGIKIHLLNIIKGSQLAKMYLDGKFKLLDEDKFIEIVSLQIGYLKEDIIVHRIGADSIKEDLIAPDYVNKKFALNDKIDLYLENIDLFQSDLLEIK